MGRSNFPRVAARFGGWHSTLGLHAGLAKSLARGLEDACEDRFVEGKTLLLTGFCLKSLTA